MEKLGPDLQKTSHNLNSGLSQIIPVGALITGDKYVCNQSGMVRANIQTLALTTRHLQPLLTKSGSPHNREIRALTAVSSALQAVLTALFKVNC